MDAVAAAAVLQPSARRGRPGRPSAACIGPCRAAALPPRSPKLCSVPPRRRGEQAGGASRPPAAAQPECRQRARRQEVFHPVGRAPALRREPGSRRVPALHRDVRAAASLHPGPASPSEQARHREAAIRPPEACRDDRRAAARRGDPAAVQRACCREPGSQSARASLSGRVWSPGRARSVGPRAQRSEQGASRWAQARDDLRVPLPAAEVSASDEPRPAGASARAAAERRREAAALPGGQQAGPVGEASAHAAAGPQPGAAPGAWERQGAAGAAEEPDGLQAGAEVAAALPGAAVQLPAEALRADEAERPRAAARPGARVPQAARRRAVPSAAASVFRQDPNLGSGPARRRAARRSAHAMQCLPFASRSEPWSQAARNEDWSWWSTSPEGSLTKCFDEQLRVGPDCGGRSGRGPIYFCTQITSLWRRSLRIQTLVAIAGCMMVRLMRNPAANLRPSQDLA